jgi:hypothetical protein
MILISPVNWNENEISTPVGADVQGKSVALAISD